MSQTKAQLIDAVDGSIVTADIADGAINNAKINASAAIAGSKISPTFTSNVTISNNDPSLIFTDGDANPDFKIRGNGGELKFIDTTDNNADRLIINSDGHVDVIGNLDVLSGIDVTGAITGTGDMTIDTNTLHVDSSNNRVGIGTTSPTKVLEVSGSSSPEILLKPSDATPGLFIGDSNRTSDGQHLAEFGARWNGTKVARIVMQAGDDTTNKDNGQLVFFTSATGTPSERLRINEQGDIGINESSPSARLHVNGGSGLLVERSAGTSVAGFKQTGSSSMNIYFQNSGSTNHPSIGSDSESLTLGTGNNERIRVTNGGAVGIGTTSPSVKLHVDKGASNSTVALFENDDDTAYSAAAEGHVNTVLSLKSTTPGGQNEQSAFIQFNLTLSGQTGCINEIGAVRTDNGAGALIFRTRNSSTGRVERMRLASNGNLGVGSTNPNKRLLVDTGENNSNHFVAEFTGTDNPGNRAASCNFYYMLCGSDDNRTGLYWEHQNVSNVRMWMDDSSNLRQQTSDPTAHNSGTSFSYAGGSDYRLKENVVNYTNGITELKQLKPYKFNYIETDRIIVDKSDVLVSGFYAHEAGAVVPNSLIGTKDEVDAEGGPIYQSLKYEKFVPLLTAALQEAVAKIEALEIKVAALEAA